MRNISFSLTTDQVRARTKTVTRRLGWKKLKPGDRLQACVKCMGLKPREKIQRLCVIQVVSVSRERLNTISRLQLHSECRREGFPNMSPGHFVQMFCRHMKCRPSKVITRIEFKYL